MINFHILCTAIFLVFIIATIAWWIFHGIGVLLQRWGFGHRFEDPVITTFGFIGAIIILLIVVVVPVTAIYTIVKACLK